MFEGAFKPLIRLLQFFFRTQTGDLEKLGLYCLLTTNPIEFNGRIIFSETVKK